MHAVTNTQSKKGNGLGMANVMYDKEIIIFSFSLLLSTHFLYHFTLQNLDRISICFSQRLRVIHSYKDSIIFGTELMI